MRYLELKQGVRGSVGIAADFWHAKGCDKGRYKGRGKGRSKGCGVLKAGLAAALLWATSSAYHRRGRTCVVGTPVASVRFGAEFRYRAPDGSVVPMQPVVIINSKQNILFADNISSTGFTICTCQPIVANTSVEAFIATQTEPCV